VARWRKANLTLINNPSYHPTRRSRIDAIIPAGDHIPASRHGASVSSVYLSRAPRKSSGGPKRGDIAAWGRKRYVNLDLPDGVRIAPCYRAARSDDFRTRPRTGRGEFCALESRHVRFPQGFSLSARPAVSVRAVAADCPGPVLFAMCPMGMRDLALSHRWSAHLVFSAAQVLEPVSDLKRRLGRAYRLSWRLFRCLGVCLRDCRSVFQDPRLGWLMPGRVVRLLPRPGSYC